MEAAELDDDGAAQRESPGGRPLLPRTPTTDPRGLTPRLPRHCAQDIYCIKQKEENIWEDDSDIHCYAVGDGGVIRYTSNGGASPWRTLFSGVKENLRKVSHRARAALPHASPRHSHISPRHPSPARW